MRQSVRVIQLGVLPLYSRHLHAGIKKKPVCDDKIVLEYKEEIIKFIIRCCDQKVFLSLY